MQTTGDGIVAALQVLTALMETGTSLHDWHTRMRKMPQVMINVQRSKQMDINTSVAIREAVVDIESTLAGRGRVLLRPSGTEPVVRVMIEAETDTLAKTLAQQLAAVVESELSG